MKVLSVVFTIIICGLLALFIAYNVYKLVEIIKKKNKNKKGGKE